MTDEELVAALTGSATPSNDISIMNGIAVFQILNGCPAGWGVKILDVGCNFYFDEGSPDTVQKNGVNLSAGEHYELSSSKSDGCVQSMFIAVNVYVPNEGVQMYKELIKDCPPNMCMSSRARTIGPKRDVSNTKGRLLSDYLELIAM